MMWCLAVCIVTLWLMTLSEEVIIIPSCQNGGSEIAREDKAGLEDLKVLFKAFPTAVIRDGQSSPCSLLEVT